jgi:hypothetical protein
MPALGLYVLFIKNLFTICDLKSYSFLGPDNVPITITNEGYILFDFDKSSKYSGGEVTEVFNGTGEVPELEMQQRERRERISYSRFKYMNSAMLILISEAAIESHKSFSVPQPCAPDNYAVAFNINGTIHIQGTQNFISPSNNPTHALCTKVINKFIESFNSIFYELGDSYIDICSLIYSSCFNYSQHDFSSSLLIAWAAAEKIITALHTKYVGTPSKWKMDRNIKGLTDKNIITGHLLSQVEEAKQARNDFAHNLNSSSSNTAAAAIFSAARLIGVAIRHDLQPQLKVTRYT